MDPNVYGETQYSLSKALIAVGQGSTTITLKRYSSVFISLVITLTIATEQ